MDGTMSDNPYAATPTRLAATDVDQGEIVLASRFKRLIARIIDGILSTLLFMLCVYLIPGMWDDYMVAAGASMSASDLWQQMLFVYDLSLSSLLQFALGLAVLFALQGYFLAHYGQTIGKMALNVKIVDEESHEKPSLTKLFVIRECGMTVFGIVTVLALVDVLLIFGSRRKCIHDYWSRTLVVQAN